MVERSNSKGNIALDASPKLSIRVSFKSNKGLPMQKDVILRWIFLQWKGKTWICGLSVRLSRASKVWSLVDFCMLSQRLWKSGVNIAFQFILAAFSNNTENNLSFNFCWSTDVAALIAFHVECWNRPFCWTRIIWALLRATTGNVLNAKHVVYWATNFERC